MSTSLTNTQQLVEHIIDDVLAGSTLKNALRDRGLTAQAFARILQGDRTAAAAYARAAELRADLLADEIISIADGDEDPAKVRNQIQARQWLASKLNAKRYGDRIDLNVTQTVDIGATLAEARARLLRPANDQLDVVDVQAIDLSSDSGARSSDKQSLAPDIFS